MTTFAQIIAIIAFLMLFASIAGDVSTATRLLKDILQEIQDFKEKYEEFKNE